ncbi:ABC transporter permease [Brevibacillus daliensis]|uniref:ABC transporter permease n=1 Tax=Brevibacillus daliensis TaxID=2892995 RepID=UPI001E5301B0|nr:ABC transporter permease [Brevibacillus daliensis]
MKFLQLTLKNLQGNWHRYIAFYLSSLFSVMMFYIYAAIIYHPDVINGQFRAAYFVRPGMIAAEYIVFIFSFFFILYSCSAFLKTRKKEFGLLTLFGFTKRQLVKMVFIENMVISISAIIVGILLGAVFSKLFFMALSNLLNVDSPIRFMLPLQAVLLTFFGFLLLFGIITIVMAFRVGKSEIIDLIREARKPKKPPVYSRWLVALAVLSLGTGYGMAAILDIAGLINGLITIVLVTTLGTYFFFTQGSIAFLGWLTKRKKLYYRNISMVVISQMGFKIKDNARTLFSVAIISAIILTAIGSVSLLFDDLKAGSSVLVPHSFAYLDDRRENKALVPDQIRGVLEKEQLSINYEAQVEMLPFQVNGNNFGVLMKESDYNHLAKLKERTPIEVISGQSILVNSGRPSDNKLEGNIQLQIGNQTEQLMLTGKIEEAIIAPFKQTEQVLVVNDKDYQKWLQTIPEKNILVYHGIEVDDWMKSGAAATLLKEQVGNESTEFFLTRYEIAGEYMQISALTFFVGFLICILFFLAAGSLLYFRLFTELQEDRQQYNMLSKIGVSAKEINRIVRRQIAFIFYAPCIVGIIHAVFAFIAIGTVLSDTSVWGTFLLVIGIFLGLQTIYYLIAKHTYKKVLLPE